MSLHGFGNGPGSGDFRPNPSPCQICDNNPNINSIHPACMYRQETSDWALAHVIGQKSKPAFLRSHAEKRAAASPIARPARQQGRAPRRPAPAPRAAGPNNSRARPSRGARTPARTRKGPTPARRQTNNRAFVLPADTVIEDEDVQGLEPGPSRRSTDNNNGELQRCTTCTHEWPLSDFVTGVGKCRHCRENYQRLRDERIARGECPRLGHPNKVPGIPCQECKRLALEKKAADAAKQQRR
ncbi:hypothetical protein QBC44DRAFT_310291 [Cladorrhinum sp. PSN332]|nr:hypothetical protein QBC44DRAFT_310291 [Cladorrhinum sp. PSN332]